MISRLQRCFLFFGGDGWPGDRHVEEALRARLPQPGDHFIGQDDVPKGRPRQPFPSRVSELLRFAQDEAPPSDELVLVGRSSGGRIATLIAPKLRRPTRIVALAYPFKHPDKSSEPERYQHLAQLQVPMLIVQGSHDEYGAGDPAARYELSPAIETHVVPAQHTLRLTPEGWDQAAERIGQSLERWAESAN